MRKRLIIVLILFYLVVLTISGLSAYLIMNLSSNKELQFGEVSVSFDLYYIKNNTRYEIKEAYISEQNNIKKKGIYFLNVVDPDSIEYIENLRIDIYVSSSVLTYVRIKLQDSLIRVSENFEGVRSEVPITTNESTPFYIESTWYKNSLDDYYYYQNSTKMDNTPIKIPFINAYFPNSNYNARGFGHEVQFTFSLEAVQAYLGPENNWDLPNPPWGGSWM